MCKDYVVCEERSNHSRIHWQVCRDRCENSFICQAFQEKLQELTEPETEGVTNRQWDAYARRIENANMKAEGHSLTASSIARRANSFVVDIRSDTNTMIVKKGWREAMKGGEAS